MRWLVGDVQGCVREFERLLREIRFDPHRDELWCLGDLVNRGPHSLEVLRLWRDTGGRGLLGNHDLYALLAHSGARPRKKDTLESLFRAPDADELLDRLRALPILAHLPGQGGAPDVWIVHAGLHPSWQNLERSAAHLNAGAHDNAWLARRDVSFAATVRCCTRGGRKCRNTGGPEQCPPPYRPWDDFYRGQTLVVHGHWAMRGHYRGRRTMGLDSGCVYGGALTAWNQDEDRVVQVTAGTGTTA